MIQGFVLLEFDLSCSGLKKGKHTQKNWVILVYVIFWDLFAIFLVSYGILWAKLCLFLTLFWIAIGVDNTILSWLATL